jgi:hypothetical protein
VNGEFNLMDRQYDAERDGLMYDTYDSACFHLDWYGEDGENASPVQDILIALIEPAKLKRMSNV